LEEKNRKPVVMLDAVFLGQQLMVVAPRCLSLSLTLVVGRREAIFEDSAANGTTEDKRQNHQISLKKY
jgi:hypothetical protein